jgi:type II secretory pathway pseudopilin PulG
MAELLVTVALVGLITPLAVAFLMSVQAQTRATLTSSATVGDVRLALTHVERQVRSGHQPLTVSPTTLSLATCDDAAAPADVGRVRVVEFRIESGALQTRSHLGSQAPGGWRTVISGLDATSAFAAAGTNGVRVTVGVAGGHGRRGTGDTVVSPRNGALPTPLPDVCS